MDKRTGSLLQRKKEARKVVQSDCLQSLVAAMQAMETHHLRRGRLFPDTATAAAD